MMVSLKHALLGARRRGRAFQEISLGTFNLTGSETVIDLAATYPLGGFYRLDFSNVKSSGGGDMQLLVSDDGVTYPSSSTSHDNMRDMTGGGSDLNQTTTVFAFARVVPTGDPGYSGTMIFQTTNDPVAANGDGGQIVSDLVAGSLRSNFVGGLRSAYGIYVRYLKFQMSAGTFAAGSQVTITQIRPADYAKKFGTLLDTLTISTPTANAPFDLPAGYDEYNLVFSGLTTDIATTGFWWRFSDDGGSTFKSGASDYNFQIGGADRNNGASLIIGKTGTVSNLSGAIVLRRINNGIFMLGAYAGGSFCGQARETAFASPVNAGQIIAETGGTIDQLTLEVYGTKAA